MGGVATGSKCSAWERDGVQDSRPPTPAPPTMKRPREARLKGNSSRAHFKDQKPYAMTGAPQPDQPDVVSVLLERSPLDPLWVFMEVPSAKISAMELQLSYAGITGLNPCVGHSPYLYHPIPITMIFPPTEGHNPDPSKWVWQSFCHFLPYLIS